MSDKQQKLPISIDDFKKIRTENYYFVDKSELISDILHQGAGVYLFTRPRRFGKSLNLSMLDAFFNIRYQGNKWFDGLKVTEHEQYANRMNSSPVVHISMKELSVIGYPRFINDMKDKIANVYDNYLYLHDDEKIRGYLREAYLDTSVTNFNETGLTQSIAALCKMLYLHHGVKPIVLIDEYDKPLNDAFGKQTYPEILEFLKGFYSSILKGNEYLDFAVVTGVMQISKESIFSGLNNLYVNNVFSKDFDERYGFTPEEVKKLCSDYGRPKKFAEAKKWYDGYRFGKADIYNPWSLLYYVQKGFEPGPYWAGTSGNDIIETLVADADDETYQGLKTLGDGGELTGKDIWPTVAMEDLGKRSDAIYSVLVMSGYLKAVPYKYGYKLSVPNREMYAVFADIIVVDGLGRSAQQFKGFFDAAESGDVAQMETVAFSIFAEHFQDWDLPDEGAYRRILAGAAMSRCGRYTVSSEEQSGNGRSDLIMKRNSPSVPNIVIEFKKTKSEDPDEQLADAKEGLRQIKTKEYYHSLKGRTILYGVAMQNKRAKVLKEELDLARML